MFRPAAHATASSAGATDWGQIIALYNLLAQVAPSPVVEINRAVALAMHEGPAVGLELIDAIPARGDLADYHLAHSVRAQLGRRLGRTAEARAAYQSAASWSSVWPPGRRPGRPAGPNPAGNEFLNSPAPLSILDGPARLLDGTNKPPHRADRPQAHIRRRP